LVNFVGIYEGVFFGEIVALVLENVVGGLLENIMCSFVGKKVGDEKVGLLGGCAVGDEFVANEMIGNIDGVKVGVSVGLVVGNYHSEIVGLLKRGVFVFSVRLFEKLVFW
jgi:hypothetical protein